MKKQTITFYIAKDGKKFDTKGECIDYENGNEIKRRKISSLRYELRSEVSRAALALSWMQRYKSTSCTDDYYTKPNSDNVYRCETLPRAEALYLNAKKEFLEALNKHLDFYSRVDLIAKTSHILNAAIGKRKELTETYKNYKQVFNKSIKRIAEIEKEIATITKEIKNNE